MKYPQIQEELILRYQMKEKNRNGIMKTIIVTNKQLLPKISKKTNKNK